MAMININRQTNDMFYRYKMPKLAAKVEGTGNGIKTVLVNVSAIAKALYRPPACKLKKNKIFNSTINLSYFLIRCYEIFWL